MNSLPFKIATRYLISKKSTNAINIITGVSMLGMAVGSLALVLVLSVFNGFEGLVVSLYKSFNPEILITAKEGKVFTLDEIQWDKLQKLPGVEIASKTLEENAILKYQDNEYIATLKGVDEKFTDISGLKDHMVSGDFVLRFNNADYAIVGAGVAGALSVNVLNDFNSITIFLPKRGSRSFSVNPADAFIRQNIKPAGIFSIQQEFDNKFIFVPLEYLQDVLRYTNEVSGIEIKTAPSADVEVVKNSLRELLGESYHIKDRFQQNEFLYKVMRTEKWAVYAILSFILVIAAFNIIGSLSMLVIEKTKDIAILKAMGATNNWIKRIFLFEGMLSSLIGSFIGIMLAILICWIQITFGVVKLHGSGTFVIDSYPVELRATDFLLVAVTVFLISLFASYVPAHRAANQRVSIVRE